MRRKTKTNIEKIEKPKVKKKIKKNFIDNGTHWEASKIILRVKNIDDTYYEIIKKFSDSSTIMINKNKIGKKTKIAEDKWAIIVDVIEDEKDLTFVLEPII